MEDGKEQKGQFFRGITPAKIQNLRVAVNPLEEQHNPFDHSRHYGTEAFEGIRAFYDITRGNLHIINFEEHISRLFKSMQALYIIEPKNENNQIPVEVLEGLKQYTAAENIFFSRDKKFVKDLIIENLLLNIEANLITPKNNQIYIRPLITRSSHKEDKLGVHSTTHRITLEIMVQEWSAYLNNPTLAVYPQGIQNPLRKHKCGANYGFGGVAKNWATVELAKKYNKKFDDALLHDFNDNVDEATGANIFAFENDSYLLTPPKEQYILPGTKREIAIQIAKALNINVFEESFKVGDLFSFKGNTPHLSSAFLTGTATGFEAIYLFYDSRSSNYIISKPNDAFIEMKREYNALIKGEEVHLNLKELQQKVVFNNTVDFK